MLLSLAFALFPDWNTLLIFLMLSLLLVFLYMLMSNEEIYGSFEFSQLLEDSLEDRLEKAGGLLSDSEKAEGEAKDGEWEDNKVQNIFFIPLAVNMCLA